MTQQQLNQLKRLTNEADTLADKFAKLAFALSADEEALGAVETMQSAISHALDGLDEAIRLNSTMSPTMKAITSGNIFEVLGLQKACAL